MVLSDYQAIYLLPNRLWKSTALSLSEYPAQSLSVSFEIRKSIWSSVGITGLVRVFLFKSEVGSEDQALLGYGTYLWQQASMHVRLTVDGAILRALAMHAYVRKALAYGEGLSVWNLSSTAALFFWSLTFIITIN